MRALLVAGAALALSACGGGETETNAANEADPLAMDNLMMDPNLSTGMTPGMDANGTMDANMQNMLIEDATTNDADTNLANGM